MKKLRCRNYLNHATTREKLYVYAGHLLKTHRNNLPMEIKLWHLACSELSLKKAYEEVSCLANQVEENYNKR